MMTMTTIDRNRAEGLLQCLRMRLCLDSRGASALLHLQTQSCLYTRRHGDHAVSEARWLASLIGSFLLASSSSGLSPLRSIALCDDGRIGIRPVAKQRKQRDRPRGNPGTPSTWLHSPARILPCSSASPPVSSCPHLPAQLPPPSPLHQPCLSLWLTQKRGRQRGRRCGGSARTIC